MTQLSLGLRLKEQGMQAAAEAKQMALMRARTVARVIAESTGFPVCINDVNEVLAEEGIELGNAAGSVFKESYWEAAGFVRVGHAQGHGRMVRMWRLKPC